MFVLRSLAFAGGLSLGGVVFAQAAQGTERMGLGPLAGSYTAQIGVDAWQFLNERPNSLLMMATNTQWHYRPVSPWGTFDGRIALNPKATLALKARANQEMGSHVDELSAGWAVSPSLGFKAGVLDYKTSWCRTYDVDSPWVRETDPFCNVVNVSGPTGGAPGIQIYTNMQAGPYRVQAIAGAYSPLLFDYDTKEFSNLTYPRSRVDKNNKQGFSINMLNVDTATEFRLGLLSTQQEQAVYGNFNSDDFRVIQKYHITFAGVSFQVTPRLNARVQTLQHVMSNRNVSEPGSAYPNTIRGNQFNRESYVVELNYQHDARNMFAFAASTLLMDNALIETNHPYSGYTSYPEFYDYKQQSISVAWRRDWSDGLFTALQLTRSTMSDSSSYYRYTRSMSASGLGMRIGYRF